MDLCVELQPRYLVLELKKKFPKPHFENVQYSTVLQHARYRFQYPSYVVCTNTEHGLEL